MIVYVLTMTIDYDNDRFYLWNEVFSICLSGHSHCHKPLSYCQNLLQHSFNISLHILGLGHRSETLDEATVL